MTRKCEVELFAIAVGVVGRSGTGRVSHNLEVVSETNTLHIPVLANILSNCSPNCAANRESISIVSTVVTAQHQSFRAQNNLCGVK